MADSLKFSRIGLDMLACPVCQASLEQVDESLLRCTCDRCLHSYPVLNGIPILINESNSIFRIRDFIQQSNSSFRIDDKVSFRNRLIRNLPKANANLKAHDNYNTLSQLLLENSTNPLVLVVGGRVGGKGMESLLKHPEIQLITTDVIYGPETDWICDAHNLPFKNSVFDGVISQAVLEHVVDPYRCVEEMHRILKPHGLIYVETPFMQQVHEGRYDFTRFTHLGHRRLFRYFREVSSGAVSGPGMALAWAYRYFLLSFTSSQRIRAAIQMLAHLTSFWLKYFDRYLIDKAGTFDAASGYYFIGTKEEQPLSDRELIKQYRGLVGT